MSNRVTISIALCTYNGGSFSKEQLQSYAAQQLLPDELDVCDDGSKDRTIDFIEQFALSVDFPVRLYRNEENLRSTKNFEKAISLCNGDLIAISDLDNASVPSKLRFLRNVLLTDPQAAGAFSNAEIVNDQGEKEGYTLWDTV